MAFQVREFEFDSGQEKFLWNFKISNINNSQLDFYSQEASSRSLLHLSQDFVTQLDQAIEKKHKTLQSKNRMIRKLAQKMLKELKVNLQSFSQEIQEEKQLVLDYFAKKITDSVIVQRIEHKCKRWILAIPKPYNKVLAVYSPIFHIQVSMRPQQFYDTTHRFMQAYIRDGKKLNPDYEALNQIYVVTVGDHFKELPEQNKQNNQNLVLVDVNLNIEEEYISESFLWDSEDVSNIRIKTFSYHFLMDILQERGHDVSKVDFPQIQKDTRVQIRTQILYKTLLKRYAPILLNFSAMDIPIQVKQYIIPIGLKLSNSKGMTIFEDNFEWDILNQNNNVEQFVNGLIEDYELDAKFVSELCYQIRTQINQELEWKFQLLVKTFKSIHKDRESLKFNTQTTTILKKNLAFSMDVNMPNIEHKESVNSNIYFNNSDLFSLLSRNLDILPEDFQEILMCKESKNPEKDVAKISKEEASMFLKKNNQHVQANPYLSSIPNTNHLHSIWRKTLAK